MKVNLNGKTVELHVSHHVCQPFKKDDGTEWMPKFRAVTHAELKDNGVTLGQGMSMCSWEDDFVRHEGTSKAVSRALKNSGLNKAERTALFNLLWKINTIIKGLSQWK